MKKIFTVKEAKEAVGIKTQFDVLEKMIEKRIKKLEEIKLKIPSKCAMFDFAIIELQNVITKMISKIDKRK